MKNEEYLRLGYSGMQVTVPEESSLAGITLAEAEAKYGVEFSEVTPPDSPSIRKDLPKTGINIVPGMSLHYWFKGKSVSREFMRDLNKTSIDSAVE